MTRAVIFFLAVMTASAAAEEWNGRWNIKVFKEPRSRVWWLEISGAGTKDIKGRFVGAPGGSMDDIPEIAIRDGELMFAFQGAYRVGDEAQPPKRRGVYRARLVDGKLRGAFAVEGTSLRFDWEGQRAPKIDEKDDLSWKPGKPILLFNGRDLSNWKPMVAGKDLGWTVRDGVMVNRAEANNLVSDQKFWNFQLQAEYRIQAGSNSGIALRSRYEVQIVDDFGKAPARHGNASLYSRIAPSENASKAPGQWQTLDVTLIGRSVTVILNGKTIIHRREIEGLTAMANDADESVPGPIAIQGDHGSVEFRKLVITPLTR